MLEVMRCLDPDGVFVLGEFKQTKPILKNHGEADSILKHFQQFLRFGHWSMSHNTYGCVVAEEAKADQKLGVASDRETRAEVPLLSIGCGMIDLSTSVFSPNK